MTAAPPILSLRDAALAFADKRLFEGLSVHVGRGDRLALVGLNGTGKSTLMNCLAGLIEIDAGERFVQPGATIALVPQDVSVPNGESLVDFVAAPPAVRDGVRAAKQPLAPHVAEEAIVRFGLDPAMTGGALSGGENRRAALARAFARGPDVLLLDEPTNHLDIAAIEELERALAAFAGGLIVISHDRAFLNAVSNATLWLQRRRLLRMDGPFRDFEAWSEDILAREIKTAERLNKAIDRETRWLHRGVTARRRRNQGRLRRLSELREARRARSLGRTKVTLTAGEGPPASQLVADLHRVSKGFEAADGTRIEIVRDFTTRIMRGDRVGLLGPNGSGKTTLLRLLVGELAPDKGRIKLGARTEIAYFDQARRDIDPTLTPWRFLCPAGGDQVNVRGHMRHVVGYLKEFLFDEDDARARIGTLSGGQRNRLLLARTLARPSNVLVLDEPTNDLDMDTLDKLQETLANYDGTLIVVSHDRDFLDQLVTSLIVLEGDGNVREYIGGYDDYLRQRVAAPGGAAPRRERAAPAAVEAEGDAATARKPTKPGKLSYKDQRALDALPGEIRALEDEIARLEARLADPALFSKDPDAFAKAAARLEDAKAELAAREDRWLELEALREEIAGAAKP